jgi:hypothetical protein
MAGSIPSPGTTFEKVESKMTALKFAVFFIYLFMFFLFLIVLQDYLYTGKCHARGGRFYPMGLTDRYCIFPPKMLNMP